MVVIVLLAVHVLQRNSPRATTRAAHELVEGCCGGPRADWWQVVFCVVLVVGPGRLGKGTASKTVQMQIS